MGTLKKYEFTDKAEFESIYDALPLINGQRTHHQPFILGFIVLEQGTYDAEGNELTPAVFSDKFCVDIYKEDSEDFSDLTAYEVTPTQPRHKIA